MKKINTKYRHLAFLLFTYLFLVNIPMVNATAYEPMEEIPGFGRPTEFPEYLMALYKFGLWAIGVCAMVMIMIGGYIYLTSAGNTSQTGKAKGIITDALAGLLLALVSYVLLAAINPDLVKFVPIK